MSLQDRLMTVRPKLSKKQAARCSVMQRLQHRTS